MLNMVWEASAKRPVAAISPRLPDVKLTGAESLAHLNGAVRLWQPARIRAQGFHTAGGVAVRRSSCKKDRMKIPTMYVRLSNVRAVAKPALSMR